MKGIVGKHMLTKPKGSSTLAGTSMYSRKQRRFSPLMLIGISVPLVLALIAGGVFATQKLTGSHAAAAPNPNCTITVPPNALTAKGLATPYILTATNAK